MSKQPKIEIERQEPLELPPSNEDNFDVFAKNSDTELDENSDIAYNSEEGEEEEYDSEMEEEEQLSPQEILNRKSEALVRLETFVQHGKHTPSRQFDMSNSLEEIENELNFAKTKVQMKAGVSWSRNILIFCTAQLENGFTMYDPDTSLNGWSNEVTFSVNTGDYDQVLEELYVKYSPSVDVFGPELKLVFMLIASATMYTATSKAKSISRRKQFQQDEEEASIEEEQEEQVEEFTGLSPDTKALFDNFISNNTKVKRKSRK